LHVWLRRIERVLFAMAAVCFVWYAAVHIDAAREQTALSRDLERASAALPAATADGHVAGAVEEPDRRHPPAARRSVPGPSPAGLVGKIEMPRLQLTAYAREGVDTKTLRGSVGHVPGTALPGEAGNAAFAAHRDTFFRPLKGVRKGDAITVTTPAGQFHYVVSATAIVDPSDVSVLGPTGEPTLTFVTCYPFDYIGSAPQRFIVSARLVQGKPGL
jgi:sortase A